MAIFFSYRFYEVLIILYLLLFCIFLYKSLINVISSDINAYEAFR